MIIKVFYTTCDGTKVDADFSIPDDATAMEYIRTFYTAMRTDTFGDQQILDAMASFVEDPTQ